VIGAEFELTIGVASVSLWRMKNMHIRQPVMRSLLSAAGLAFILVCVGAPPALAKITPAECEADYAAMLAEIESNRQRSLDELNRELRYTTDDDVAASINAMIDQAWEIEETFLGHAANAYRDCMKYAKQ